MNTTPFIALCDGIPEAIRTGSIRSAYQEEYVRIKDAFTSSKGDECAFTSEISKVSR